MLTPSSGDSDKPGCDFLCHTPGLIPAPTLPSGVWRYPPDQQTSARNPSAVRSSLGMGWLRPFLPGLQSRDGRIDPVQLEILGLRKQAHYGHPALQGPAGLTKMFHLGGRRENPKRKPLPQNQGQSHLLTGLTPPHPQSWLPTGFPNAHPSRFELSRGDRQTDRQTGRVLPARQMSGRCLPSAPSQWYFLRAKPGTPGPQGKEGWPKTPKQPQPNLL